ncbi:methionyl-tRNA formyltransferase [Flavihumibacter petaseus]|uniref:Methionyl-tRNA formyltransferase n=1 Tax=Flavihumibacter petaseus NBRC 106054 TaxID=1220578 RepID=A0A0E9N6E2_9BACT|nr:methionyl-tRNA formyltransferase [Flavihumibacter petaseus]GAO45512.1 methionyl-tRNA formyltransferase [Flavihumibacter petaseus NBRC 106054]
MDYRALRIVFMGTPPFAVASLDALVRAGCQVVGVVTAADKPAGRGMTLQASAVKQYAVEHQLPILQPEKLRDPQFQESLAAWKADLQVVVAFRMLPESVWNMPPLGTINVHGSLLPQYRGAAPINWAVINGEKETGVTTFRLQHEIDTGNVLLQAKMPVAPDENAGSVHDRMMVLGAETLVETIKGLASGNITPRPQESMIASDLKHAPKIFTETCQINWDQPLDKVYNLIRGLSPYPAAFTTLEGKTLRIFAARKEYQQPTGSPGSWLTDQKTYLKFAAQDGYLMLDEIQLQGKKRMPVADFLRGYRFTA